MPYEDDGGSLAVSAAQRPGKDRGGERKERHDHQQQGVQEQYEPVAARMWSNMTWWLAHTCPMNRKVTA